VSKPQPRESCKLGKAPAKTGVFSFYASAPSCYGRLGKGLSVRMLILAFGAVGALVLFMAAYLVDHYSALNIQPEKNYYLQMGLAGSGLITISLCYFIWHLLDDGE
jgi:hypothetical protein